MFHLLPLFLALITGCGAKATPDPAPTEEPAPAPDPAPAPEPEPEAEVTPASLYAECEGRVEGKQQEGECDKDEDCVSAGCGKEVCLTSANAADIMTTCEDRLCFKVLDACGCHEGQCTWSLKDEIPAQEGPKPATRLPPTSLPPTTTPKPEAEGDGAEGGE
jgi:eight-cysteine-cluster-containing protein